MCDFLFSFINIVQCCSVVMSNHCTSMKVNLATRGRITVVCSVRVLVRARARVCVPGQMALNCFNSANKALVATKL